MVSPSTKVSPRLTKTLIQRSRGVTSPSSPKSNPDQNQRVVFEQQIVEIQTQDESKSRLLYASWYIGSAHDIKPLSEYIKMEKYMKSHKFLVSRKLKLLHGLNFELDLTHDLITNFKTFL